MKLTDYFSDESIIRELCKARISFANRRHEALFFHGIDVSRPSAEAIPWPDSWREIRPDIFPPRKQWNRFRPKDRSNKGRDYNLEALVRAVRHLLVETPNAEWAQALLETTAMIKHRALHESPFRFTAPVIVPEPKDKKKNTYRPLASLFLVDRIIDCIAARYFRETLNEAFLDSCLAFRPKQDGRHKGLDQILALRSACGEGGLFVAECDIKGFYDCVSHEVAREAFVELIADAREQDDSLQIDARAIEMFEAYLGSYSFLVSVRRTAEPELRKSRPGATYPGGKRNWADFAVQPQDWTVLVSHKVVHSQR